MKCKKSKSLWDFSMAKWMNDFAGDQILFNASKNGWELVAVTESNGVIRAYFKRKKS